MNWLRAIAGVLVLWTGTAWGATLTWNANSETDVAGYRVYQCTKTPCTKTSGTASPLATLGKVTSFNIGTPAVTTYYFTTAYDFANNESNSSSYVTYTAAGSTTTSTFAAVSLTVVGNPATGPWGVSATIASTQAVFANVFLDGLFHHTEHLAPWSFPGDNGTSVTTALFGKGTHTVEFVFYLQNTTTEIGRASIIVLQGT